MLYVFFVGLILFVKMYNPRAIKVDTCICIWLKKIFLTGNVWSYIVYFEKFESMIIIWTCFFIHKGITWSHFLSEVKTFIRKLAQVNLINSKSLLCLNYSKLNKKRGKHHHVFYKLEYLKSAYKTVAIYTCKRNTNDKELIHIHFIIF